MEFKTLTEAEVKGKTVILRLDINSPLDPTTRKILDLTRIKNAAPTIKELVEKGAKVVMLAHQGRKGSRDFTSLEQHAKALGEASGIPIKFVGDLMGEKAIFEIKSLREGEVLLLDNVRNWDGETLKLSAQEHAKSELVKKLAPMAQLYVNDAFAAAHRSQCSLVGFTSLLPSYAGRLLEKELKALNKITSNPAKPFLMILGGAKFSDVPLVIERMFNQKLADKAILAGLPAHAFYEAKGISLGVPTKSSLKKEGSPEVYDQIKKVITKHENLIHLPIDFGAEVNGKRREVALAQLPIDSALLDIGDRSIQEFKELIKQAKTIFVSGPMGVFEKTSFRKGTRELFNAIARADAFSLIGGAHTIAAIKELNLQDKISYISTGGGALESFMIGKPLPVVEALKEAKKRMER
jgi:phosphoglycerate kinase